MPKYDLTKILPHKPPMILIDDILEYNLEDKTLTAIVNIHNKKILFDKIHNGINAVSEPPPLFRTSMIRFLQLSINSLHSS